MWLPNPDIWGGFMRRLTDRRITPGHERQLCGTLLGCLLSDACSVAGVGPAFSGGPPNFFNRSFFVWEPPGEEFDDLLLWMTRE